MKVLKKIIILLVLLVGGFFLFHWLYYSGTIRFNYPSNKSFPVKGIDISHHQGTIDWAELAEEDVSFIFIKATEGGDFKDPRFKKNWNDATKNNYDVSAYHYYSMCKSGEEQANNLISTVPELHNNFAPVVDLEFDNNCNSSITNEKFHQEFSIFIELLQAHYHKSPIIYLTYNFYEKYIEGNYLDCPLWFRDIYKEPKLTNRKWQFWQFANRGHLDGIEGFVDLNVFNGSKEEYEAIFK